MSKGYLIAHIAVHDPAGFEAFRPASAEAIRAHGGRVLVRSPTGEVREGQLAPLTIIVEFEDIATARRFYESPAYTAARALREPHSTTHLVLVEGL
jgi:uncharacterized protein (DUF1330 family)